jgi:uncharacterized phage protein (TIGR02220 family)
MEKESKEKGFWIPIEIFANPNLKIIEKNILAQIHALNNSERGCFASNSFFSKRFNISKGRVSQIFSKLKKAGYIEIKYIYSGNAISERKTTVVYSKLNRDVSKLKGVFSKLKGGIYSAKGGYLENAKDNNITEQYITNNITNIINSQAFKTYLEKNNLELKQNTSASGNNKETIKEIISYLNQKADKNFKTSTKATQSKINARLKEGFEFSDFKKVVDLKVSQWKGSPKMDGYLRPETLFGTKFESYVNEKPGKRNGHKKETAESKGEKAFDSAFNKHFK